MKNFHVLVLAITLCSYRATAQGDSAVGHGTVRVSKPLQRAFVMVFEEYAVFRKMQYAPKTGKSRGKEKFGRGKDTAGFVQNKENPMPLVGRSYFISMQLKKLNAVADIPKDLEGDSTANLSEYLSDTINYSYKFSPAAVIDTVQLKIFIDKTGLFRCSFASRRDSLLKPASKCMEGLLSIKKWQPAYITYVKKEIFDRQRGRIKRKKVYSEILITILLTNVPGPVDTRESSEK